MKLLHIITLASTALAFPIIEKRGPLLDSINAALTSVASSARGDFGAIHESIVTLNRSLSQLPPAIETQVQSNLNATNASLKQCLATLQSGISKMATTAAAQPKALTYGELENLKMAFSQIQDLVLSLKASLRSVTIELGPAIDGAISGEMEAIRKTAGQFVTPLQGMADVVKSTGARGNLQAIAYGNVLGPMLDIVKTLAGSV